MANYRRGKQAAIFDPRVPLARTYKALAPVALPDSIDYSGAVPVDAIDVLGNDDCGNCAFATSAHFDQFVTANAGKMEIPTTSCTVANYAACTNYDPKTGANDNGTVLTVKNHFWMNTGLAIYPAGALDKLDGFAQIEGGDLQTLMQSLALFGPTETGAGLPGNAEAQFETGKWDDTSGAPEEGHDFLVVGYFDRGAWFKVCTWTGYVMVTNAWMKKYMDEGTALLRRKWIMQSTGLSPTHKTMRQLADDINAMRGTLGLEALA